MTDPNFVDLIEAFTKDFSSLPLAEDVVLYERAQDQIFHGRVPVDTMFQELFEQGFADVQLNIQTILVDEQTAVLEFVFHGRHHGRFMGIPPTQRVVNIPMVIICHIQYLQLQQASLYYDAGTLLRQIGFVTK